MSDFKYEIIKEIGIISERKGGWSKQLNLISWNDAEPKYDIQDWSPNREKMGKGISLSASELQTLTDMLNEIEL